MRITPVASPAAGADAGPFGSLARTSSAGGRSCRRRSNQPGSGSIAGRRRVLLQPLEHVEILPLDDRPVVVVAEELPAVAARATALSQRFCSIADSVSTNSRERFVEQAGVAAEALALQHVALAVGQHRPSERPRLERHHRQALEVRRHDQQIGGRHRVELVGVVEEAEVADARMLAESAAASCR